MKFDLDKNLLDLDGAEIMRDCRGQAVPMTMKFAIRSALVAPPAQEIAPAESLRRYDLQAALVEDGVSDLSAEDIVMIKDALAKLYGPLVTGPIMRAMDKPEA